MRPCWGLTMFIKHATNVLWHPVGADPEEILLVHEGAEVKMYLLTGKTGGALWTRLDGSRTLREIIEEMVATGAATSEEAEKVLSDFIEHLSAYGLVVEATERQSCGAEKKQWPWPVCVEPPDLTRFDPESLLTSEMVALGSFQGGQSNATGKSICQGGIGGTGNSGDNRPCGAGPPGAGRNNASQGSQCRF